MNFLILFLFLNIAHAEQMTIEQAKQNIATLKDKPKKTKQDFDLIKESIKVLSSGWAKPQ